MIDFSNGWSSATPDRAYQLGRVRAERLVEVLHRHGVEYLIVGGVAARAYGRSGTRRTSNAIEISTWRTDAGDLDVLVDKRLETMA